MQMRYFFAVAIFAILTGCSTTSGLNSVTSVSQFDGVKSVYIEPHGAACKAMVCPGLGATWLDKYPEDIGFNVQVFNEITSINSVSFNIDGEMIKLDALSLTNFNPKHTPNMNSSVKTFVTKYAVLTRVLESKRTWLRVSTSDGNLDVAIIDGTVDSKAFHALKRFDTQVKEAKMQ